jgi:hypothetical protein
MGGLARRVDHHGLRDHIAEPAAPRIGVAAITPTAVAQRQKIDGAQQIARDRRQPTHRRAVGGDHPQRHRALAGRLSVHHRLEEDRIAPDRP